MSARALRKVLNQQQQESSLSTTANINLSPENDSDSSPDSPRPFTNPFDLLNDQDQIQVRDNDSSDDDVSSSSIVINEDNKKNISANVNNNKKSKKKKKNKKKNKEVSSSAGDMGSIDDILGGLSVGGNSSVGRSRVSEKKVENVNGCKTCVLQVDPRFLNAENELRRIFGSKVVSSFEKSNKAGSSRQGRPGRRVSVTHRKTVMVTPSEHWPRWDGSLSMELLEEKNKDRKGCNYFRYVPSATYSLAQRQYEAFQASHDLNGIASVLLHHPYHLDSLTTLADYFKFSGELQMSIDATAKSLYALECAWHPLFNPLNGNVQLKYVHETNQPIFTALFAHMKNMDRRGCHRSALEICKLLLSLDSDDPKGALFCIDYFALRAEEYKWLELFSEEYSSDNSLWLFPNFSFSLAVCRFYLEREEQLKENETKATSSDLMKQALMLHPSVLKKLVAKVPLKEQVWSKIVNHSFFATDDSGSASLDHLINIYVERSYIIWRLPELSNFLKDSALSVIEKMEINRNEAKDWACVRQEAFSSDKNEYSQLMVSEFSDSIPTIPPEHLQNLMVDPRLAQMHNAAAENQENIPVVARAPPREVANRNALAVLFESLLPWADYGPREDDQENGMARDDQD
ncbi:uncharacterized protein [Rutidosis leptorrhynchoides]|uniref:uncharacterized protein n=1 Tax=Rutidosis leptorrhynchoides TaxID=125765 RepID=UPI003A99A96A